MKLFTRLTFINMAFALSGLAVTPTIPIRVLPSTNDSCGQTIAADARAVSRDLSAMASQANADGFGAAVELFAADMETILPTLNRPSQDAVQKFVKDLAAATSASGPGGTAITASERLGLSNDWVILMTTTGISPADFATVSEDLATVLGTLKGISADQLKSDFNILLADAQACTR